MRWDECAARMWQIDFLQLASGCRMNNATDFASIRREFEPLKNPA
jgi:hypothetical protein